MKILTLNLWHGLSPSSLLVFEPLEPLARRRLREKLQVQLLKELDADIAFFQEMNPILHRFRKFTAALDRHGVIQPDLVGLKFLGVGLPINLFSGLAILAKPDWPLRKIKAVRLSGQRSFVSQWMSFQLHEERYALFAETVRPNVGKILLINTHLHHGLEATEDFVERLNELMDDTKLSATIKRELRERLAAGNERRAKELSTLLKEMEKLKANYEMVILGGDFNCSPEGEVGQKLRDVGFTDVWAKGHPGENGFTFDRTQNLANHILQDRFPSTFLIDDLSFDESTKERFDQLTQAQERRPRRIDQLWVYGSSGVLKSMRSQIVGLPSSEGLACSDHFGLLSDLDVE